MNILNMVIHILICFKSLVSNWSVASHIKQHKGVRHPKKYDVINDVKLFLTVYRRIILLQIFYFIQSDVVLQTQEHKTRLLTPLDMAAWAFNGDFCPYAISTKIFRNTTRVSVLIQIRLNILSGQIWVQTVCTGYQQTTLFRQS